MLSPKKTGSLLCALLFSFNPEIFYFYGSSYTMLSSVFLMFGLSLSLLSTLLARLFLGRFFDCREIETLCPVFDTEIISEIAYGS